MRQDGVSESAAGGSCVREPDWTIAAVREVDEPTVNPLEMPEAMFATPNAARSRLG